jgi:thiamine pyrophosphate-dependent acetolactate synthase large subunit-like protein
MTTFAVAFAEALEELGVQHAFGVTGGAISFFWSALGGTGIEVTHFRHESGAAFAACEASIASGRPGPPACRSWPPLGARASSPRTTRPTSA